MRWPTAAGACRSMPEPTSIRPISSCCSPMKTGGSIRTTASILLALSRAALQLVTRGHIVSGGSTITMQLARLMEPRRERSVSCQAAPDRPRGRDRAAVEQGADSRSVSGAGALWRQSRRHSFGLDRLFRQGAETAVAGGIGAAGGVAAIAGKPPPRSLSRMRRAPRGTACSIAWSRSGVVSDEDAARAKARAGAANAQADSHSGAAFRRSGDRHREG